jgi:hypothetical protein
MQRVPNGTLCAPHSEGAFWHDQKALPDWGSAFL